MKKRIMTLALALLLAFALLPFGAAAAEDLSPYEGLLRQTLYETWGQGCGVFVDFDGDGQSELVFLRPESERGGPSIEITRAHADQTYGGYGYESLLYERFRTVEGGQSTYQAAIVRDRSGEIGVLVETAGTSKLDSPDVYRGLINDYTFYTLYLYRGDRFVKAERAEAVVWHTVPDRNGEAAYDRDLGTIRINGHDVLLEEYYDWRGSLFDSLHVYAVLSPHEVLDGLDGDALLSAAVTGFYDTPYTRYYAEPVKWAAANGITNGTGEYVFSPEASCTRAQAVAFLWRAAGCPAPKSDRNPFVDVPGDAYYRDAVLWAAEQGVTNGTGATAFSPNDPCTRAQVVTFLHRFENSPQVTADNPFQDVTAERYYYAAVLWAVERGITNGTGDGAFCPDAICTRGQIVTFLYRDMT